MKFEAPPAQGLYDPRHEHDACGVGFVVDLKGRKSTSIVERARGPAEPRASRRLRLRGEHRRRRRHPDADAAPLPGRRVRRPGIKLPAAGQYGVGMVFLPHDAGSRAACEHLFEQIVREEGQTFLGWRDVPTDNCMLGPDREAVEPVIRQIFIERSPDVTDDDAFERKLLRDPQARRDTRCAGWTSPRRTCSTSPASRRDDRLQGHAELRPGAAVLSRPARRPQSSRRWRWCTRASARTRSRPGSGRIRFATWRTTARSTRCAATSTGCTPARACSSRDLFGDDLKKMLPGHRRRRQRLGDVRQRARAAGARGPVAAARDDDADSGAVAEPREHAATNARPSTNIRPA